MRITVHYVAQLKRAAGTAREPVELEGGCTLTRLIRLLASARGEAFRGLTVDGRGEPQPSLLVFVGEEQVRSDRPLCDGDQVTLLTPMAGG
jgi:molybdopterin converting factor small subunit